MRPLHLPFQLPYALKGGFSLLSRKRLCLRAPQHLDLGAKAIAFRQNSLHLLLEQPQSQPLFGRRRCGFDSALAEQGRNALPQRRPLAGNKKPYRPVSLEIRVESGIRSDRGEPGCAQRSERGITRKCVALEQQNGLLVSFEQRPALSTGSGGQGATGIGRLEGACDVDRAVRGEREHLAAPEGAETAVGQAHEAKLGVFHRLAGVQHSNRRSVSPRIFASRLHRGSIRVGMIAGYAVKAMVMDFLPILNAVVSDARTIGVVCLALVGWSLLSGRSLAASGGRIRALLNAASERLASEPKTPIPAERFEAIRRDLAEIAVIGPTWRAFAEAVVVAVEPNRPVRATIAPDRLFDLALYRRVGTDLRYHTALPGLLVGTGLLFTFLGLAIALANAGALVTAADQAQRSASLEGLLNAASIKFWTSLVGLFCSIGYAIHRKRSIKKTERALDRFCTLLEERFPLATPAFFQAEANRTLDAQRKSLDTLANDLAQSIGPALDRALDTRLGEHIKPLREAIEKLATRETEAIGQTLKQMLDLFLEKLQATSSKQLEAVAGRLEEAAKGLESLRFGLDGAGAKLETAANTLARELQQGSRAAIEELARTMRELSDKIAQAVQQQSQQTKESLETVLATIPGIVQRLSQASETIRGGLEAGGKQAGALMEEEARKAAAALVSAADTLGQRLASAATRFEKAAERTEGGAAHFQMATEALKSRFSELETAARNGAGTLQTAAQQAAQQLQGAADQAAQQLLAATEPYTRAAQSLSASSTALRESAQRMAALDQRFQEAIGGLQTIATGLAAGARQLEHVSKQFEAASARFAGIDASLGRALEALATQYQAFAQQIGETVRKVDENLGKAVNALDASVRELSEIVDDLQAYRTAAVRRP